MAGPNPLTNELILDSPRPAPDRAWSMIGRELYDLFLRKQVVQLAPDADGGSDEEVSK